MYVIKGNWNDVNVKVPITRILGILHHEQKKKKKTIIKTH